MMMTSRSFEWLARIFSQDEATAIAEVPIMAAGF
jgi:hypothetical protein